MEEQLTLKATPRDILGKRVKILRDKGQVPGVLYGRNFKNVSLILDKKEFQKIADAAGEATLINLDLPRDKDTKVLIRNIQYDPVKDNILHVDLYKVDMTEEIETEIPLEFIGVSPAVEELEGNLITNKNAIKVKCLPNKLVSKIEVDISVLKSFEDFIHVKDLNIPAGIEVLEEKEDLVAQVTPPRSEEELEALEEETKAAAETEKEHIESIEKEAEAEKAEGEAEAEEETAQQPGEERKEQTAQ